MRVLVISQYWFPENGVPQRRWAWLSELLTQKGHEVLVVAPPPHYEREQSIKTWWNSQKRNGRNTIEVGNQGEKISRSFYLPTGRSLSGRVVNQASVALGSILKLKSISQADNRPDLVIGTVPALPTAFVTMVAAKIFKVPYILDLRDAWPELLGESNNWNKGLGRKSVRERILANGPFQLLASVTERLLNRAIDRAAGIIVTSSRLGDSLRRSAGSKPIAVVRNVFPAVTIGTFECDSSSVRKELKVLYAGTIGRAQNLTNAIVAADLARKAGINVSIRFVGAGAAKKHIRDLARELRVSVEFIQRSNADDLADHYEWAHTALVHLTNWDALERAVPSKTYELMDKKIHISAVLSGETAELIGRLGAGHVVDPEEPEQLAGLWISLVENPNKLQVSNAAAEWVDRERREVAPENFLSIVNAVCKGGENEVQS